MKTVIFSHLIPKLLYNYFLCQSQQSSMTHLSTARITLLSMIACTNPSVYVFGLSKAIFSLTYRNTITVSIEVEFRLNFRTFQPDSRETITIRCSEKAQKEFWQGQIRMRKKWDIPQKNKMKGKHKMLVDIFMLLHCFSLLQYAVQYVVLIITPVRNTRACLSPSVLWWVTTNEISASSWHLLPSAASVISHFWAAL